MHSDVSSRPADPGPPDAHLGHISLPGVVDRDRHTPFLRAWATISTPVFSGWIVVLLTLPTPVTLSGLATFLVVFAGVEAVARRRVRLLVTALAVVTAWGVVEAGLVLALLRNWQLVLAGVLALTAAGLLLLNLRELAGHSARQQPYESVPGLPPPRRETPTGPVDAVRLPASHPRSRSRQPRDIEQRGGCPKADVTADPGTNAPFRQAVRPWPLLVTDATLHAGLPHKEWP